MWKRRRRRTYEHPFDEHSVAAVVLCRAGAFLSETFGLPGVANFSFGQVDTIKMEQGAA